MAFNHDNNSGGFFKNLENNGGTVKINSKESCAVNLMENLKKMLDQRLFCDIVLIAGDGNTKIAAHRNILTASSKYFYAMFTSGMAESSKHEIPLKGTNGKALKLVIDYCYTGEIEVNSENVEMLLSTASQLEFLQLEKECSKYLEKHLQKNPLNCLSFYSIAQLYNLTELKTAAQRLMYKNFMEIKDAEEFLSLDFNVIKELVQSDNLRAKREEDVFTIALKWINYDKNNRQQHLVDLLKVIRYTKMELTFLTSNVSEILISNGLKDLLADSINIKCVPNCMPQRMSESLLRSRGWVKSERKITAFILLNVPKFSLHREFFDGSSWKYLVPTMNSNELQVCTIVKLKNEWLFVTRDGIVLIFDDTFSIRFARTREECHVYYSAVCWEHYVVLVGGTIRTGIGHHLSFYKFHPSTKQQTTIASLLDHECSTDVTVGDNKIYYYDERRNVVRFFDLTNNIPGILRGRNSTEEIKSVVFYNGYLYVAGENYMEKYDCSTETWTLMHEGKSKIITGRQTNQVMRMDENENKTICTKV